MEANYGMRYQPSCAHFQNTNSNLIFVQLCLIYWRLAILNNNNDNDNDNDNDDDDDNNNNLLMLRWLVAARSRLADELLLFDDNNNDFI